MTAPADGGAATGGADGDGATGAGGGDGIGDDRGRYRIVFEGDHCIATGRCAEVSENWQMDLDSGVARPREHYVGEDDLAHNLEAARVCPARNGDGVIRVVDTATGEEVPLDGSRDGRRS